MEKSLREYVELAMVEEQALMTYRNIIELLDHKISSLGKSRNFLKPTEPDYKCCLRDVFGSFILQYFLLAFTFGIGNLLLMSIRKSKRKKRLKEQYKQELIAYERAVEAEKEPMRLELLHKSQLLAQKQEIVNRYNTAAKSLSEYYACNVIFPKYRDFISIATICEYLESGRCSILEGPDGAYNLYESEKRQNLIITHLENIEMNLNELKNSQYMLYMAICETNNILSRVASRLNAIDQNMEISAYNTQVMKNELQMQTIMQMHTTFDR